MVSCNLDYGEAQQLHRMGDLMSRAAFRSPGEQYPAGPGS